MTAKIINGKELAQTIRTEIAEEVRQLQQAKDITPGLAVILAGDNPASRIYVKFKERACEEAGIYSETITFDSSITEEKLIAEVERLNNDKKVHGILVQLPLPDHIYENHVINALDPDKDVDGFHPVNVGKMVIGKEDGFLPCTPYGIKTMLVRYGIETEGAHVVVVGRSNIVGKPAAIIMMQKATGANATVTVCHSRTRNLPEVIKQGDIVIAAMGRPEFITKEMIKPGATVIDVGVNRVDDPSAKKGYRLAGDVAYEEVKEIAGAITPVPGGVGPMTIAMLLANTVKAAKRLS